MAMVTFTIPTEDLPQYQFYSIERKHQERIQRIQIQFQQKQRQKQQDRQQ